MNNEYDFRVPIPRIENVVGMVHLKTDQPLKLGEVASKCNNSEYNPRRFNGMIWRNKRPKATFLIFPNGKTIIAGSKSETQFLMAARKLSKRFTQIGAIKPTETLPRAQITNVVSTVTTRLQINLQRMNRQCIAAQHEPSTFPGLIYRMKTPKVTFLVFSSGKIVITGARSEKETGDSFKKFHKIIKKYQKRLPLHNN